MAVKKKKAKSIKKGNRQRLHPKTKETKLINLTAKKQELRYRDRKGRLVAPEKINGRKYLTWEIWRYSNATRRWKKLEFGKKWEIKERKLKRAKTPREIERLCLKRYQNHKIKVRKIKGDVFAYTASP